MTFPSRRILTVAVTIAVAIVLGAFFVRTYPTLRDAAYGTGWTLLGMMLFLTLYNARKKLPYPPLFSSAVWLQMHVYVGWLAVWMFLLHIGFHWPNGVVEVVLALLFIAVSGSGILGLFLSRAIPRRLSLHGEEVLFERIAAFRRQIRERAETLVIQSAERADAMTIADYYHGTLSDFFTRPRHLLWHVLQSARPVTRLTESLQEQYRYLNEEERRIAEELHALIEAKDSLDYHYAMQGLLKLWLFVHIPLTACLLVFAVVHTVVVHTFVRIGP